ncbi:4'-phosphopantetheinyl transferase family protein [Geodermatophilus sp. URMC 64]
MSASPDTAVPALPPGVCQVWWARTSDVRPEHDLLLAPGDVARRARFVQDADRRRATAALAVLRTVLGIHLEQPPAALEIDRRCRVCGGDHGKPWLPAAPDVHFSVSHSGSCVAVAIHRGAAVGVDVEKVERFEVAEPETLAEDVLAPEEQAELARYPVDERSVAFTTYWSRKEAVLKATGDGVTGSLADLVVTPPSAPPAVLRWPGAAVSLHALRAPADHVAALAVVGAGPVRIDELDARQLLGSAQSSRRLPSATTRNQR